MTHRRGFTLIELVIVIAIIGILASLAIPRFIDMSIEAKHAAAKAGLGIIRSTLATKYAASATGGSPASYPTSLAQSDFANNERPKNPISFTPDSPGINALFETIACNTINPGFAFWYVSSSSSPDYGKAGAYASTGGMDSCGW